MIIQLWMIIKFLDKSLSLSAAVFIHRFFIVSAYKECLGR